MFKKTDLNGDGVIQREEVGQIIHPKFLIMIQFNKKINKTGTVFAFGVIKFDVWDTFYYIYFKRSHFHV